MQMINDYPLFKNNNLVKKYETDAGLDIRSPDDMMIPYQGSVRINTQLHVNIFPGFVGLVKGRSSLAIKHDIECSNAGVIDSGYTGVIFVLLRNFGKTAYYIKEGDRIAQLLTFPIYQEKYIEKHKFDYDILKTRGTSGIGSTGK